MPATEASIPQADSSTATAPPPANSAPTKPKRRKRIKAASALPVTVTGDSVIINQPAPIDRLPYELRRIIIGYLDNDAFTILNLLLVSKVWYITLNYGQQAEEDWAERCKRMDAKRKSAGCTTWHLTFVDRLHRRCICFYQTVRPAQRPFLPYGFTFILLCPLCPLRPSSGPLAFVRLEQVRAEQPDLAEQLDHIPAFRLYDISAGLSRLIYWHEVQGRRDKNTRSLTCGVAVELAQYRLQRERAHSQWLVENVPSTCSATSLQDAFAHHRQRKEPFCTLLQDAVHDLRLSENPDPEQYLRVTTIFEILQGVMTARDEFCHEHHFDIGNISPALSYHTSAGKLELTDFDSWINHLVRGDLDIEDYLRAIADDTPGLEKNRQARLKRLGRQKAKEASRRLAGESIMSLCISPLCRRLAGYGCLEIKCAKHCLVPCTRHMERKRKARFLAKGLNYFRDDSDYEHE